MTLERTIAVCLVALLATLAFPGASRHAGSAGLPPGAVDRADGAEVAAQVGRGPRLHLADTGGSRPLSFFESLFGMPPPRSTPRRQRRPSVRHRSPSRESQPGWRRRQSTSPRRPARAPERRRQGRASDMATYRTVCVRLCDGYYWPISFATGRDSFGRDNKACARSCDSPAALYYYPNPGGEREDMVNLDGLPYTDLGTAFLYRATYSASCKCRPHPWETEAVERHRKYTHPQRVRAAAQHRRRRR